MKDDEEWRPQEAGTLLVWTKMITTQLGDIKLYTNDAIGSEETSSPIFSGRIESIENRGDTVVIRGTNQLFSSFEFHLTRRLEDVSDDGTEDEESAIVDVLSIRRDSRQPRKYFDETKLRELGECIKQLGLLRRILIRKLEPSEITDDGCLYELIDGERRWRAHKLMGLTTIKVLIKAHSGDPIQRFLMSFASNLHAAEHTPYETALAIARLNVEGKMTGAEISRAIGLSPLSVYNYLSLQSLAPEIFELLNPAVGEDKVLRVQAAFQLAKIGGHDEQRKALTTAQSGNVSPRIVARRLYETVQASGHVTRKRAHNPSERSRSFHRVVGHIKDQMLVLQSLLPNLEDFYGASAHQTLQWDTTSNTVDEALRDLTTLQSRLRALKIKKAPSA